MSLLAALLALPAGLVAGAINAVAGGGSIVSFPALIWLGIPPVQASATNTVALWPGYLGASWGFRAELKRAPRWTRWLFLPSLAGGALGAFLLLRTPPRLFRELAPWLVLAATILLAVQEPLTRRFRTEVPGRARAFVAALAILAAGTYAGYFGAGLGILLYAILAMIGVAELHLAAGMKNLLSAAMNGVAVAWFACAGSVHWLIAVLIALGAILGGWLGAALARRVSPARLRRGVIAIGVVSAAALLVPLLR